MKTGAPDVTAPLWEVHALWSMAEGSVWTVPALQVSGKDYSLLSCVLLGACPSACSYEDELIGLLPGETGPSVCSLCCAWGGGCLKPFLHLLQSCGTHECQPHCSAETSNQEMSPGWQLQKLGCQMRVQAPLWQILAAWSEAEREQRWPRQPPSPQMWIK